MTKNYDDYCISENTADNLDFSNTKESISRKLKIRKIIITLIAMVVIIAIVIPMYFFVYAPNSQRDFYNKIANKFNTSASNTELPDGYLDKFGALYEINDDIGGWLTIPGTDINYPVVLPDEDKNTEFYKEHLFDGKSSFLGTPYFYGDISLVPNINDESYNKKNTQDNLVVIANGELFGELEKCLKFDHYLSNSTVMLDTVYNEGYWKIIAAFYYNKNDSFDPLDVNFNDHSEFIKYVENCSERSGFIPGCDVNTADVLLTIVSNNDDGKNIVLVARSVRENESLSVDTSLAKEKISSNETLECIVNIENIENVSEVSSDIINSETSDVTSDIGNLIISIPDISIPDYSKYETSYTGGTVFEEEDEEYTPPSVSTVPVESKPAVKDEQLGTLTVIDSSTGETVTDTVVNIVASIVEAEVGGFSNIEVLKAQAVASYTYLLYYNTSEDSPVAVAMKKPQQDAVDAARAVAGQAVVYGNNLCCTQYFSASAGRTTSCAETWGSNLPYLVSVDSSVETSLSVYKSEVRFSSDDIKERVFKKLGISLSEDKSQWLKITAHDSGGRYVTGVSVEGKTTYVSSSGRSYDITGRTICETLLSYQLKSHAFDVMYDSVSDEFVFTVYGNGHGVGMSQYGANEYAKQGYDYIWILKHYYSGASVEYILEY